MDFWQQLGSRFFPLVHVARGFRSGEQATYYQEQKPRRGATRDFDPDFRGALGVFFKGGGAKEPGGFFATIFPLATLVKQTWGNANLSFTIRNTYIYIYNRSIFHCR